MIEREQEGNQEHHIFCFIYLRSILFDLFIYLFITYFIYLVYFVLFIYVAFYSMLFEFILIYFNTTRIFHVMLTTALYY
jgi:hypothetical protein